MREDLFMHMADALLSPTVGVGFWAASLGGIAYSAKKLKNNIDEKMIPLMGVIAAFVFAAQMINFTIPATGSSGHLGGGLLLSILLGPYAAFIAMTSVLIIQALFFADGGLLALGCNIWNLGFYTCFVAYPFIFKPLSKGNKYILWSSVIAAVVGLQLGAFSVVLQTLLSGKTELHFTTFVLLMQPIHLGIGIVEGLVTFAVINFVRATRPELLDSIYNLKPIPSSLSLKKLIGIGVILTVVTGGLLSWFASANPDGLEWSIEKVYGKPELPENEKGLHAILKSIQEKTAFLPDYNFKKSEKQQTDENQDVESNQSYPSVDIGTSISGVLGSFVVIVFIISIGFLISHIRKKNT